MDTYKIEHHVRGDYVLTGIPNVFNSQVGWWISKKGAYLAHYCFSSGASRESKDRTLAYQMRSFDQYCQVLENAISMRNHQRKDASGHEQRVDEIVRPDGTRLKAEIYPNDPYPCININLINQEEEIERVCFAEYNPEREPGHELCVGVYYASDDETVYYDSYYRQKEEDE